MVDFRSKFAALRARQKEKSKVTSLTPVCSNPALAAAFEAVGQPQQSWDKDFKERLAGLAGSEDELEELVVLPPPPVKLDPIAARIAWRKEQLAAANEKAQRRLAEQYPVARLPKPEQSMYKEDVNDEEDLLLEEEAGDSQDEDGEQEEDEMEGLDGVEIEDNAEESFQVDASLTGVTPAEKAVSGDLSIGQEEANSDPAIAVDVSNCDKLSDEELSDTSAAAVKPQSQVSVEGSVFQNNPSEAVPAPECRVVYNESPVTPEPSCGASPVIEENPASDSKEVISPPDNSGTIDSSRVTAQLKTGSSSTAKSNVRSTVFPSEGQAFTASSSRKGPFSKLLAASQGAVGATVSSRPLPMLHNSAFIDDEAEDELDGPDDGAMPHADSDADEEEALQDAGVVADSQVPLGDAERLAQFHRRWVEKYDGEVAKSIAENCKDMDSAMDLTELLDRTKRAEPDNDDAASEFCMGSMSPDRSRETVDKYIETMFRDDNSRSVFDNELETPEKNTDDVELSRRKARALWKARQKNRSRIEMQEEKSLSLLGLFSDCENEHTGHHRPRIENAHTATPARQHLVETAKGDTRKSVRGVKRTEENLPEWQRRRMCLERVEKRRRTAVSLEKWSYASEALGNVAAAATGHKAGKPKRLVAAPVGGGSYDPKPVAVEKVRPVRKGSSASKHEPGRSLRRKRRSKGPSFEALFDALDERPTTDLS